mgnify:CR=1 FL=1|jgi:hypothetical protein
MKKQNLLLLGAVAIAGFYAWKKGMFGGKKSEETTPEEKSEETKEETPGGKPGTSTSAPTIIDISKGNITPAQAIEQAKNIVETVKNAKVLIKTKKGQKNIVVSKKKKKPKTKKMSK